MEKVDNMRKIHKMQNAISAIYDNLHNSLDDLSDLQYELEMLEVDLHQEAFEKRLKDLEGSGRLQEIKKTFEE